ncbi:hypothetical protein PF005_g10801 [Phytophthora fragariae]|uniref:RxLR effector protein n=1 Tax=Phytophthora fragariae TaxID=53985 RepID=A0A6A3ZTF2_9STRA|nr:hypothetical protein PF003_g15022 [Phytophthora fragariae]KAE8940728.1 hypothetical protein PF009_g9467 [Phytophthora fragariae]KAE9000267.1 hypothetical protein PF011_g14262 [Phytophthora fragariae]KAE9102879.1 hypothetical protein PF007_g14596 [Phytophthora fragariae]KAE9140742.1 hypothetical protein PF006_g13471 [Phytophthora fragariae]
MQRFVSTLLLAVMTTFYISSTSPTRPSFGRQCRRSTCQAVVASSCDVFYCGLWWGLVLTARCALLIATKRAIDSKRGVPLRTQHENAEGEGTRPPCEGREPRAGSSLCRGQ